MKKIITALLIASLLAGPSMATETVQKALVCEPLTSKPSWRDVDMKKTLHGAFLMFNWFYWKNGRVDLAEHVIWNEGADKVFDHPFIVFFLMMGKEGNRYKCTFMEAKLLKQQLQIQNVNNVQEVQ